MLAGGYRGYQQSQRVLEQGDTEVQATDIYKGVTQAHYARNIDKLACVVPQCQKSPNNKFTRCFSNSNLSHNLPTSVVRPKQM